MIPSAGHGVQQSLFLKKNHIVQRIAFLHRCLLGPLGEHACLPHFTRTN
jgi:hypothetical protein